VVFSCEVRNKKALHTSPWQTGKCRRALSYLLLQFGVVRIGVTLYGSTTRQSGIGRIIGSPGSSVKCFFESYEFQEEY
jgi:hypothetical protein